MKSLSQQLRYVRQHQDIIFSIINLLVFIFVITAVVDVTQVGSNPAIHCKRCGAVLDIPSEG